MFLYIIVHHSRLNVEFIKIGFMDIIVDTNIHVQKHASIDNFRGKKSLSLKHVISSSYWDYIGYSVCYECHIEKA